MSQAPIQLKKVTPGDVVAVPTGYVGMVAGSDGKIYAKNESSSIAALATSTDLAAKQDALVSETNIKSISGISVLGAGSLTGVQNKQDFLWNLDTIPDFDVNGLPDPLDPKAVNLTGMYFNEDRSHFFAGRKNHRNCFSAEDAQYSAVFGWGCYALDSTGSAKGANGKGAIAGGYQTVVCGSYGTGFGFSNLLPNSGFVAGFNNWAGGARRQITGHTFTNDQSTSTIKVAGDRTAEFPSSTLIGIRAFSPSASPYVGINRVTSSSFSAGETSIVLDAPLDFQIADATTADSHGDLQKSWICTLAGGPERAFCFGLNNWSLGSYSTCVGVASASYNTYSFAFGKDAVSRNKSEMALGGGAILDGDTKRYGQKSIWYFKRKTTNNTPIELTLDGNAPSEFVNTLRTQNESVMNVSVKVSAIDVAGQKTYGKNWDNVLILHKQNGDTSVEFQSTAVEMNTGSNVISGASVALSVAADGKLVLTATGHASTACLWYAVVEGTIQGWTVPSGINS